MYVWEFSWASWNTRSIAADSFAASRRCRSSSPLRAVRFLDPVSRALGYGAGGPCSKGSVTPNPLHPVSRGPRIQVGAPVVSQSSATLTQVERRLTRCQTLGPWHGRQVCRHFWDLKIPRGIRGYPWALAEDARLFRDKKSPFLLVRATPITPTIAPITGTIQDPGEIRAGHGMNARPDKIIRTVPMDSMSSDREMTNDVREAMSGNTTRNAGMSRHAAAAIAMKPPIAVQNRSPTRNLAPDREIFESCKMSGFEWGTSEEASPDADSSVVQTRARLRYPPGMGVNVVKASANPASGPTCPAWS